MENLLTGGVLLVILSLGICMGLYFIGRRNWRIDFDKSRSELFESDPSVLDWWKIRLRLVASKNWRLVRKDSADQDPDVQKEIIDTTKQVTSTKTTPWERKLAGWAASSMQQPGVGISVILFGLSLAIYLITRFIHLEAFPIYFFTDEAVHMILAEELVQNGYMRDGILLPAYFPLGASFGLNSVSVYLNIIPYLIFGKSVFVTRSVTVVVSLCGAIAIALILKEFYKAKFWWASVLILSSTPTWFYHTRTAFEYVLGASFFAIFIYFYLCYRLKSPNYLYLAILFGALVFYSHGLGQPLMGITVLFLAIIDARYHWQNRNKLVLGFILVALLAWPYFRFTNQYPTAFEEQIRMRGSYWLDQSMSFSGKLTRLISEYSAALSPKFWYLTENGRDLARHVMKGFGHLPIFGLPFLVYGLWLHLFNLRSPVNRVVLIALIASPFGAALAQVMILRVIWTVIPITIITAFGLSRLLEKLKISYAVIAIGLFGILGIFNVFLMRESLKNGPLWFRDYSLYGMQYGAKQVFGEAIPGMMERDPNTRFVVSPNWANGTDNFVSFFLTPDQQRRIKLDSIQAYLFEKQPIDDNLILVLPSDEYNQAVTSGKFTNIQIQKVINYPDGTPGFYFIKLQYVDDVDRIFAAEKIARSQPLEAQVMINGLPARVVYSRTDMGSPEAIFDGDVHTLMRGLEANPFVIDVYFSDPMPITGMSADFANMDFTLKAELFETSNGEPVIYDSTYRGIPGDPHVELMFNRGPAMVSRIRLEITSLNGEARPHIHVREINFLTQGQPQ